jgi:hypothetical protein
MLTMPTLLLCYVQESSLAPNETDCEWCAGEDLTTSGSCHDATENSNTEYHRSPASESNMGPLKYQAESLKVTFHTNKFIAIHSYTLLCLNKLRNSQAT